MSVTIMPMTVAPPDRLAQPSRSGIARWCASVILVVLSLNAGTVSPARSQFLLPARTDVPVFAPPKPLTRADLPPVERGERAGTGFFVDETGHVLTARHVVQACGRILVQKEGRTSAVRLVAVSTPYDLALLKTAKTRGLAATFPRSVASAPSGIVFAADYVNLPTSLARGAMLANASVGTTNGSDEAGHIALNTNITFDAGGAPVLDSRGLVEGVVSRKTAVNRVLAVGAGGAKAFLAASNVRLQEDDRPQISGSASRAHRAASISARIICLN